MLRRNLIVFCMCMLLFLSTLANITSAQVLDQEQKNIDKSHYIDGKAWQQFIPRGKKHLYIDVHIGCFFSGSGPLTMTVEKPLGTVVLSTSKTTSQVPNDFMDWNRFWVNGSLRVGETYYLVLSTQIGSEYEWSYGVGNPYPDGISSIGANEDFCFATVVQRSKQDVSQSSTIKKVRSVKTISTESSDLLEGTFIDAVETRSGEFIGALSMINPISDSDTDETYTGSCTALAKMDDDLTTLDYELLDIDGACTIPTSIEIIDNGNILTTGIFLPGGWGIFLPGGWEIFLPGGWGIFLPGGWGIQGVFLPGTWEIKSFIATCDETLSNIEIHELNLDGLVIHDIIKPRKGTELVATGCLNDDICLLKLDSNYNLISYTTYPVSGYAAGVGKSLVQTNDGGYAVASGISASDTYVPAVVKTDENLNMEWIHADFLPEGKGIATGIGVGSSNTIVVSGVGMQDSSNAMGAGFICKITENDITNYNYVENCGFWNMNPTSDGGFVVAGPDDSGSVFAKFDSTLKEVFRKKTSSSFLHNAKSIRETNEGHIIVGEIIISDDDSDPLAILLSSTGTYILNELFPEDTANKPPEKPSRPSGTTSPRSGETTTYETSSIDPDGDDVIFIVFARAQTDKSLVLANSYSGWTPSGATASCTIIFQEQRSFEVRSAVWDIHGLLGEFSDPLPVTVPKNKALHRLLLLFLEDNPQLWTVLTQVCKG